MEKLNEVARMQQLAGINEIRVNNPGGMSLKEIEMLKTLTTYFGEGSSPGELEPISDYYSLDNYDTRDSEYKIIKYFIKKHNGRKFFIKNLFDFLDPNTPTDGYETMVTVGDDNLEVFSNYVDENQNGIGWYTKDGEFHTA